MRQRGEGRYPMLGLRRWIGAALIVTASAPAVAAEPSATQPGAARWPEAVPAWVDPTPVGFEIVAEKRIIAIDASQAETILLTEGPGVADD